MGRNVARTRKFMTCKSRQRDLNPSRKANLIIISLFAGIPIELEGISASSRLNSLPPRPFNVFAQNEQAYSHPLSHHQCIVGPFWKTTSTPMMNTRADVMTKPEIKRVMALILFSLLWRNDSRGRARRREGPVEQPGGERLKRKLKNMAQCSEGGLDLTTKLSQFLQLFIVRHNSVPSSSYVRDTMS